MKVSKFILMNVWIMFGMLFQACASTTQHISTACNEEKFAVNKKLYPFNPNYLTLDNGAKIHYVDEGNGPTLLLLHGNPTWSFLYRKMIVQLENQFRVIAPDYPGFGLSTAPKGYGFTAQEQADAMNEFFNKLKLKDVTIMVQDWGGPIGFDVAIRQPEKIKGFIIGNTWAWPLERVGHKAFSLIFGGYIGQFISWANNGIVKFFMSKGVEKALDEEVLAMYEAPFPHDINRKQTHIFPAQLWDADAFLSNVYDNLPMLEDKPALIVWGLEDFAFQEPERKRFEKIFKNHKTILLKDAGHFIQEDAPIEICDSIKIWYSKIDKKR